MFMFHENWVLCLLKAIVGGKTAIHFHVVQVSEAGQHSLQRPPVVKQARRIEIINDADTTNPQALSNIEAASRQSQQEPTELQRELDMLQDHQAGYTNAMSSLKTGHEDVLASLTMQHLQNAKAAKHQYQQELIHLAQEVQLSQIFQAGCIKTTAFQEASHEAAMAALTTQHLQNVEAATQQCQQEVAGLKQELQMLQESQAGCIKTVAFQKASHEAAMAALTTWHLQEIKAATQQCQQEVAGLKQELQMLQESQARCIETLAVQKASHEAAMAALITWHLQEIKAATQRCQQDVAGLKQELQMLQEFQAGCIKTTAFQEASHEAAMAALTTQHLQNVEAATQQCQQEVAGLKQELQMLQESQAGCIKTVAFQKASHEAAMAALTTWHLQEIKAATQQCQQEVAGLKQELQMLQESQAGCIKTVAFQKTSHEAAMAALTTWHLQEIKAATQRCQQDVAGLKQELQMLQESQAGCIKTIAVQKAGHEAAMAALTAQHLQNAETATQHCQQEVAGLKQELQMLQESQAGCIKTIASEKVNSESAKGALVAQHQQVAESARQQLQQKEIEQQQVLQLYQEAQTEHCKELATARAGHACTTAELKGLHEFEAKQWHNAMARLDSDSKLFECTVRGSSGPLLSGTVPRTIFQAEPDSALAQVYNGRWDYAKNEQGQAVVNSDPEHWPVIINWLSFGAVPSKPSDGLIAECRYWQLDRLLAAMHADPSSDASITQAAASSHHFTISPVTEDDNAGFTVNGMIHHLPLRLSAAVDFANRFIIVFAAAGRIWELSISQQSINLQMRSEPPITKAIWSMKLGPEAYAISRLCNQEHLIGTEAALSWGLTAREAEMMMHPCMLSMDGSLQLEVTATFKICA